MRMQTDDNELAALAAGGDQAAFQVLLERHYDLVFRVALRLTGHRANAEDVTQDVCTTLAKRMRTFRGQSKFTTWLYQVTVNATRDLKRKQIAEDKGQQSFSETEALRRANERGRRGRGVGQRPFSQP